MEFLLLGPLEVVHEGTTLPLASGKQRALLADLLLHANRALPVERLVDDLWGEEVPETAVKAVQVYVSKLRKALPGGRLQTRGSAYVLEVADDELDLARCERLLGEGRRALATGLPDTASRLLGEAASLWRGPALAEFEEPFAATERNRLDELQVTCLEERVEADLALGRHAALVGELEALASRYPLRERLRAQHALALYRSGRQAEALAAYQAFRALLDAELGIEPSSQLRELERRILQQDPALDAPARPAAAKASAERRRPTGRPVGRDAELGHLHRLLGEALGGQRRVVFVTGEAGAGKTTIVETFLEEALSGEAVLVGSGQCIEHRGVAEAYLPALEAVGRLGRDGGPGALEALRTHAPTWLAQLPALVTPEELGALRARSAGLTAARMLRELADALDALTERVPVVVVLEDLHWSDASTLDLLDAIARRREQARLLVVGTFRRADPGSEGHQVRRLARALRTRNLCSELALGPLDDDAVAAYLRTRFPGEHPPELAVALRARTAGNPLFMEKLVEAWAESGAFEEDGDGWRLAVPVGELSAGIPGTLRVLIEERIEALGHDDRDLLECASAIGAEFADVLAAAAAGRDPVDAEERLESLCRSGIFVERRGERTWPDGTHVSRFAFVHDLCQEVLYERLPPGRRARVHGRVGARLEAAWAASTPEIAAELAYHFVRAHDARAALTHLVAAAERELGRTAPREALVQLDAALATVSELPAGIERDRLEAGVQLRRGPTLVLLEGWMSDAAEAAYVRALDIAAAIGDEDLQGQALYGLAAVHEVRGEYERALALVTTTLGIVSRSDSELRIVDSHDLMACSLVHQGDSARALEHADAATAMCERVTSDTLSPFGESPGVSSHVWASLANWHLGKLDAARARAERGVAASTVPERSHARAMAQVQAAMVAQLRGDAPAAERWAASGITAAEEHGYPYWGAVGRVLHGWARAVSGEPGEGIDELRRGIAEARATGARLQDGHFLALLAEACHLAGRVDEGLAAVDEAIASVCGVRPYLLEPELYRLRGDLHAAHGDLEGAEQSLRTALAAARNQGSRSQELRAAASLARLEAAQGRAGGDAARALAEVYASFDEGLDAPLLVSARALLDELGTMIPPAPPAAERPRRAKEPVSYARSGDLEVAYQVSGSGPPDLVLVPGFVSHLEKDWEEPRHAHFLDRLGSFSRLIRFDKRGTGLSDRPGGVPDLETRMDDVRAVMDAAGSGRAVLLGYSEGGAMSILFAATYPERVLGLVLYGAFAKRLDPDEDYPWAPTREERAAYVDGLTADWGFEADMRIMCPSADDAMARWWGERCRAAASPGAVRALMEMNARIDVRDVLAAIRVPTVVVHRREDCDVGIEQGRYLAERIPDARLFELDGADHFPAIDPDQILDVVEPFVRSLAGEPPARRAEPATRRVLATVLMTDLAASTEQLARLGDEAWAARMAEHDRIVREELARWRGEEVDAAGDGFHAHFDGPARAVHCALALRERLAAIGLEVRAGVHTGEVEHTGTAARGIAVHLAARTAQAALPGEVLVTSTTHDLVEGSGLRFEDRGEHELKGIERPRRLYAAAGAGAAAA